MDSKELDKSIAEFEEMVFTKVEEHFSHYILEDYAEIVGSEPLYLIEDYDRYLYWINVASEINEVLKKAIQEDKWIKKAANLIRIKAEVDIHLLRLMDNDKDQIYFDLGLKKDPNQNLLPSDDIIRLNVEDGKKTEAIKAFHNHLRRKGIISNNLTDNFISNFTGSDIPTEKIVWEKNMNQLVGMLKYLIEKGLLFGNEGILIPRLILNHFHFTALGDINIKSIQKTISKTKVSKTNTEGKFVFIIDLVDILEAYR